MNLVCFWQMEMPRGYPLAVELDLGLAGVCWSIVLSKTALAVMAALVFRRGGWKRVEI